MIERSRAVLRSERGIALPMVLMVFLVGFALVATLLIAITASAQVGATSRAGVQAQAAAEAGIAAQLAAIGGGNPCTVPGQASATAPQYSVVVDPSNCTAANDATVAFTSTGTAPDGSTARVQAVFAVSPGSSSVVSQRQRSLAVGASGIGALNAASGDPNLKLSIILPQGSYDCWSGTREITGDLFVLNGNVALGAPGCRVQGNVLASGTVTLQGGAVVGGNASAASTSQSTFGSSNTQVGGRFTAAGSINVWGGPTATGGVFPNTPVTVPAGLPGSVWYEYAFDAAKWIGYVQGTHTGCSSGGNLVAQANAATVPTYFVCPSALNFWQAPTFNLKTDVVIVHPGGYLASMTVRSADGAKHQLSVITSDPNPGDKQPTCGSGLSGLKLNGTQVQSPALLAVYTPCQVSFGTSNFRGAMIAGSMNAWDNPSFLAFDVDIPGLNLLVDEDGLTVVPGGGSPTLTGGAGAVPDSQRNVG